MEETDVHNIDTDSMTDNDKLFFIRELNQRVHALEGVVRAQAEEIKFLKHHMQRVRQLGGDIN